MTNSETYTALLRDSAFGLVVERLDDRCLVDRRPDPVIRRYVEREGRRWVREEGVHTRAVAELGEAGYTSGALEPVWD